MASLIDAKNIYTLLDSYNNSEYLKRRSFNFITDNIKDFVVVKVANILVWNMQLIKVNPKTIELWAFALSQDLCYGIKKDIWSELILFSIKYAKIIDMSLISLSNNKTLQKRYLEHWLSLCDDNKFLDRQKESPWTDLFLYQN